MDHNKTKILQDYIGKPLKKIAISSESWESLISEKKPELMKNKENSSNIKDEYLFTHIWKIRK